MSKSAVVDIFLTTLSMLFSLKCDSDSSSSGSGEWGYAVISLTEDYAGNGILFYFVLLCFTLFYFVLFYLNFLNVYEI